MIVPEIIDGDEADSVHICLGARPLRNLWRRLPAMQ